MVDLDVGSPVLSFPEDYAYILYYIFSGNKMGFEQTLRLAKTIMTISLILLLLSASPFSGHEDVNEHLDPFRLGPIALCQALWLCCSVLLLTRPMSSGSTVPTLLPVGWRWLKLMVLAISQAEDCTIPVLPYIKPTHVVVTHSKLQVQDN